MPPKLVLLWTSIVFLANAADLRVPVTVSEEVILKSGDFKASIGSGSAPVSRVRTPNDDLVVLAVMDLAGDLAYAGPAKSALAAAFRNTPGKVHMAILHAQEGLRVAVDPTSNRAAVEEALETMPVTGKAALLDTLESAVQLGDSVASKSNVRVAVLYISDSEVRNYREDFTNPVINSSDSRDLSRRFPEGLIRERISRIGMSLAKYQTPVFIVHVRYASERLNEAYQNGLSQLAKLTGGSAQFCRSAAEIPDAIAATVQSLASQYRVHVQLPAKTPKSVTLSLSSGDRVLDYRTRFVLR
jgi:hypothetical protein